MELIVENHSMYPRVGETDSELRLRRAHHQFDHGEITQQELASIENDYVEELIAEQQQAGLDIVTDGMIRWYDHISHLNRKLSGVEVGGLVRYFDTNYLVREGLVKSTLERQQPLLVEEFKFASSVADRPVKQILTGPLTLSYFAELADSPYATQQELAEAYADLLVEEVADLSAAGLKELQIEEPVLLQNPEAAEWALPLVDRIATAAADVEVRLASYFGDPVPLYDQLQESAVDLLMFDFVYGNELYKTIQQKGSDRRLVMGVLDGRNTKLADPAELVEKLKPVLDSLPEGRNSLSFTSSLDYLPRDRARLKLQRLVQIGDQLQEVLG